MIRPQEGEYYSDKVNPSLRLFITAVGIRHVLAVRSDNLVEYKLAIWELQEHYVLVARNSYLHDCSVFHDYRDAFFYRDCLHYISPVPNGPSS